MNCPFDMNKISNGTDFEIEVTDYLLELGFQAKRTWRNDFGVDIIALKVVNNKEYTFNIQCKYYNKALAFSPIQEVFSGTRYHDNNGIPVVITNNTFTASARTYASSLGVEVIGDFECSKSPITFLTLYHTNSYSLAIILSSEQYLITYLLFCLQIIIPTVSFSSMVLIFLSI